MDNNIATRSARDGVGAGMKAWSRVFVILLLLTYVGVSGQYANSAAGLEGRVEGREEPVTGGHGCTSEDGSAENPEGWEKLGNEEAFPPVESARTTDTAITNTLDALGYPLGDVTDRAIKKIAGYTDVDLSGEILKELGFVPATPEWETYEPERKLEIAYRSAETSRKGGGDNLLGRVVRELAKIYESVENDDNLKIFFAIPYNSSIQFAKVELSTSPTIPLPAVITKAINAIAGYCRGGVLGGVRGILVDHLNLKQDVANAILASSKSNIEALHNGFSVLEPLARNERMEEIIEILQKNYDSARRDDFFNLVMENKLRVFDVPEPEGQRPLYPSLAQ